MKLLTLLSLIPSDFVVNPILVADCEVAGITDDSREVGQGFIFVAKQGAKYDGNDFIPQAIAKGANVIVLESIKTNLPAEIVVVKVNDASAALAWLSAAYWGFPSRKLTIVGVTGTDGKTTTSTLIYHILKSLGTKVGLVSTVEAKIGSDSIDTGFHVTSPSPQALNQLLHTMVENGLTHAVLEVTSHALTQNRFTSINFEVAVLTNITHEHIDYHKSFDAYRNAKLTLFIHAAMCVLNADDPSFSYMKDNLVGKKIISYALNAKADLKASETKVLADRTSFQVESDNVSVSTTVPMLGNYNVSNCLAALGAVQLLGYPLNQAVGTLRAFPSPSGRFQRVANDKGITIIVDFAHTPNALEKVLKVANEIRGEGKVILVFGCAGERDNAKRPMMGSIAATNADFSIITAEDPRNEVFADIASQIVSTIGSTARRWDQNAQWRKSDRWYTIIEERGQAIYTAINTIAKRGDTILICGKGHEKSMCYGNTEYAWDDVDAVKSALAGKILEINQ